MRYLYKIIISVVTLIFIVVLFKTLNAFDDGITGLTKKGGVTEGCSCHGLTQYPVVSVIIVCPSIVRANDTVNCQLRISGGPLIAGGCDIAVGVGNIILSPQDTSLQRLMTTPNNFELTHRYPKFPFLDTVIFLFKYIAPNTPGITDTIYANGNSVNHDTTPSGDKWNYAVNKLITISSSIGIAGNSSNTKSFYLSQNYPNPFNPSTVIGYSLLVNGYVTLKVYDILGREIVTLVNEFEKSGTYEKQFLGDRISSGVYYYKITVEETANKSNSFTEIKKMTLIK